MHGPVDSPQWKFVDEHFWDCTADPRNLPPWMTTKHYFIILSFIIPRKRSVTTEHFNTFIEPLVDELELLWTEGIMMRDVVA
jgi:hypothetical protein